MDSGLTKKIKNDIRKTGFLAELHVASQFIKSGWQVEHCGTFLDQDEMINREIDIEAFTYTRKQVNDITIFVRLHLIVEVKTSFDRPWIIFTVPITTSELLGPPAWLMIIGTSDFDGNYLEYTDITKNSIREKQPRVGVSFHEAFKSVHDKSQIYEALVKSCKAAKSKCSDDFGLEGRTISSTGTAKKQKSIDFFQPVVVLEGKLVEATLNKKGEIIIREKDYIPVTLASFSQKYGDVPFYPDVVTKAGLPEYINSHNRWLAWIEQCIINRIQP